MTEQTQDNPEILRENLRNQFQALALSDDEFTPEKAAEAFSLSQRYSATGGMKGNFHASEVIDAFSRGSRPDATTASLAKLEFDLNTVGLGGDRSKGLLAGLDNEALEKAKKFCECVGQAYNNLFER